MYLKREEKASSVFLRKYYEQSYQTFLPAHLQDKMKMGYMRPCFKITFEMGL